MDGLCTAVENETTRSKSDLSFGATQLSRRLARKTSINVTRFRREDIRGSKRRPKDRGVESSGNSSHSRSHVDLIDQPVAAVPMIAILLMSVFAGLVAGLRGPHHPNSPISHHHYSPQKELKITHDAELLQDLTHLIEDMGPLAEQVDLSKMTEEELEFHYFKLHDVDNNTKLDGLEILHAIQHTLHENSLKNTEYQTDSDPKEEHDNDLVWIVEMIDRVLEEDDTNNDGYLEYTEYVLGRKRDQDERAKRTNKLKIVK